MKLPVPMSVLAFAGLVCFHPAFADTPVAKPTKPEKVLPFPVPDLMMTDALLPTPSAAESAATLAELDVIRKAIATATPERRAKADLDGHTENVTMFRDVVPAFDVNQLPLTKRLFDDLGEEDSLTTGRYKVYFARKRPYQVDPTLDTCGGEKANTKPNAYPSGHTTVAFSMGLILARLMPEHAQAILDRAKTFAESRVICGVHYPSDTVAGQALGTALAIELMHNADFRKEMEASKAELVKAGLTK